MTNGNAWTAADVPDLSGRVVVVTGANNGIGFEAARVFAREHAHASPASRDPDTARRLWVVSEELTGVRFPI